jgi:hypothetical protein
LEQVLGGAQVHHGQGWAVCRHGAGHARAHQLGAPNTTPRSSERSSRVVLGVACASLSAWSSPASVRAPPRAPELVEVSLSSPTAAAPGAAAATAAGALAQVSPAAAAAAATAAASQPAAASGGCGAQQRRRRLAAAAGSGIAAAGGAVLDRDDDVPRLSQRAGALR